jgi:hypothetical protein
MPKENSFSCPVCGAHVPAFAQACPECGACEKSGWNEDNTDGLGLPDENFNYDEFVQKEFGNGEKKSGRNRFWWIIGILILLTLLILEFSSFFRSF